MLLFNRTKIYAGLILTASLCIGDYYVGLPGFSIYQKLLLLIGACFCLVYWGIDKKKIWPYFFFSASIVLSFVMAMALDQNPNFSLMLVSFLSMSTGFIFFSAKISQRFADRILSVLIALPFLSAMIGFLLFPILGKLPWLTEYTGAFRFSGALHPAHLAMLCVIALMACCIYPFESVRRRSIFVLLILFLLLLTGARGALLAALIAILPLAKMLRRKSIFSLFWISLLPLCALLSGLLENILTRTLGGDGEALNTSGRSIAWAYFIGMNSGTELFGKGFGAVTLLTKGVTENNLSAFVVPHNEYVRFYYDIGLVGSLIFFIGVFGFFISKSLSYNLNRSFAICFTLSFAVYSFFDNTFGTPQFIGCFLIVFSALDIYSRSSNLTFRS